ncbi:MAG: thiamine pyrophosphate-dependent enzyme [Candidatus Pacearchaeota archaeon]|nr:thiamine pyrophosphate-dependent enzyme [Candidatus Pacearchaeota archaeon]
MKKKNKNQDFEGFAKGHNACAGCGAAIAMRHLMKIAGANTIVAIATGCMEVVSTVYPLSSWEVPCIHSAFENVAATASGIELALKKQGKRKINVIAIAGDGGTFDIGLQALSGMLERGHRILYVCYDNEAYMNTGIQRSSATPLHAETTTSPYGKIHGKIEPKKNMPLIVASHGKNIYVATASVGYLEDFKRKVKKALRHIHKKNGGPAYLQVLCPCVLGWKIPTNITIQIARKAVNCRAYPLFEIENGKLTLQEFPEEKIEDYLKLQGRFSNLAKKEIIKLKKFFESEYSKLRNFTNR